MATCKTCLYLLAALGWIGLSRDAAAAPPQGQTSEPVYRQGGAEGRQQGAGHYQRPDGPLPLRTWRTE